MKAHDLQLESGPRPLPFWPIAVLCVAAILALLPFDQSISDWARQKPRARWMLDALSHPLNIQPFLTLLVIIGGFSNWRRAAPAFALPLLASALITQLLKWIVGRARPDHPAPPDGGFDLEHWLSLHGSLQSFPSGHATTAAALAACLGLLLPRWRWAFGVFAVAVLLQRIVAERHYLSDTLAGATIGLGTTLVLVRLLGREAFQLDAAPSAAQPNERDVNASVNAIPRANARGPGWASVSFVLIFGAVLVAIAIPIDERLTQALTVEPLRGRLLKGVDVVAGLSGPAILVAFIGRLPNWKRALPGAIAALTITQLLTHGLKTAFGRARPLAELPEGVSATGWLFEPLGFVDGWDAFPSGHTSLAFSFAFVLGRIFPHGRAYYFAMAAFAALERIPSGWHYPSDLIAGVLVAFVSVRLVETWAGRAALAPVCNDPRRVAD